jgi:uncharacterized repeat protein (TIGR03803 family)
MTSSKTRLCKGTPSFAAGTALAVFFWLASAGASPAQTFTTLSSFDGTNGNLPYQESLVQGRDGNYYGTARAGGANGMGSVFKVTPKGKLTVLYSFCSQTNCSDGSGPVAGLALSVDGNFYGTTYAGGAKSKGTVFKITPTGKVTILHSFRGTDGAQSWAGLIQATDGSFYGTTYAGGAHKLGTVFKITPTGTLATLYSFCSLSNCADGSRPIGRLIQATDGNFYGTASAGGTSSNCGRDHCGTVFRITRAGKLTTLHSFDLLDDGAQPWAGLIQALDGNFYGTTSGGGSLGAGTVFTITAAGSVSVLYNFGGTDQPAVGFVQGTDRKFYGATWWGGSHQDGTLFSLTSGGKLTTLHTFDGTDGYAPWGGAFQATNGMFYGTTEQGGAYNDGTVFRLSVDLRPFVAFVRNSGKIGTKTEILGQGFTGTTSVSFNGTAASFSVKSDTYLTAKVPQGATTGFVTVTTPGGTLQSNVVFRVTK